MVPADQSQETSLVGTFQRHPDGYGFVRLPRKQATAQPDVYIPVSHTQDAVTGDQVRIRIRQSSRNNSSRPSGAILEVVRRRSYQFVGTYQESANRGSVLVDGSIFF